MDFFLKIINQESKLNFESDMMIWTWDFHNFSRFEISRGNIDWLVHIAYS
jgi:hypothetical protein